MILRYEARDLRPRSDSSNLGTSTASFSGSKHLGLILGLCLGILIPLTIIVVVVWRWKAKNIREKKRSGSSKRPSTKGSKGSEKSDPAHNLSSHSNPRPPPPPPTHYPVPPSSFSHTASGPSRNPQGYPADYRPRPSGGYSRPISADQSTLVATPPADAQRGPRLAPRDARRSDADMGDLIEMLNSQRVDPSGKPAHRKGKPSMDDPLKEEPFASFLPTTNDSNASLAGKETGMAPRIPSVPGVSPLDMPSHTSVPDIPPPMPMPVPISMSMPTPSNIVAQPQAIVADIPPPMSMPTPMPAPISDNITAAQPQVPKPAKPKPSNVAKGISATPAVYAPVTRSRSTDSRRMQNSIVPRDGSQQSPPASFEGSSSPLQQVEALREARAKATTDTEWY